MNITEAEAMARELFVEHNLNLVGWTFRFDKATRRFGSCNHTLKNISLSRVLTELNDRDRVRNTLLHEIAHALVGSGHNHDYTWRKMCRMIGGDGNARYSRADVNMPTLERRKPTRKIGECPNCHAKAYRQQVRRGLACASCCRKYAGNKWDERFVFEWRTVGQ